jgi:hypothetical protein
MLHSNVGISNRHTISPPDRRGRLMISGFVVLAIAIVGGSTITRAADRPVAGLTPLTEGELAAIDAAHAWIARQQQADGSWTFASQQRPNADAATALALLAFMGRGHTHRQGPYQKQCAKGLEYLVARVADDGGRAVARAGTMYAAGIVALAICRAYELTRDGALATPAQATLDFLADAQDPQGGGWRYQPRQPGDTSATGWQVAAVVTGLAAGLKVDPATIDRIRRFLDSVQVDADGTGYGYVNAQNATPSCSAIGMVARLRTGWTPDDPRLGRGADELVGLGPSANLYTDYHISQLLHMLGGERNKAWRAAVTRPLLDGQSRDDEDRGSWFAGFDKTALADRLYCTTLATLILETPLLPRPPRPQ